jgi:multidrug efflux pump subunit AcrB
MVNHLRQLLKQSFGSNANQVIEDVKAKLETIEKLPKGMDYEISYDVSKFWIFFHESNSYFN